MPNIYQEMDWKIDTDAPTDCETAPSSEFNEDLDVCIKNIFYKPLVGYFSKDDSGSLIFKSWGNEETPMEAKAYRIPCTGDSGGSSWITNGLIYNEGEDPTFKYVIASIMVRDHNRPLGKVGGIPVETPCGSVAWKPILKDWEPSASSAQKTTTAKILNWIKQTAVI